ncbi:MAG: amidohydrolase [Clostridiales bacterium]|nr:amidohydrolase [Clostridiales bacterium]
MKDLIKAVDKNRQLILDAERYIWKNPETGYKEFKTSAYMAEKFTELGYELVMADGITGFYTTLDTGKEGPTVLILGELDSIICPSHPEADPQTGAVHSCGHNAQCAALLGVAAALKEPGILDKFCGKIKLCAVPAEELLEIEFRTKLMDEGKIRYFGGKPEFLARGYFDDVDIAFMVHTSAGKNNSSKLGSVGCLAKRIVYKGVASHAGGAPWAGRNALYAATCGLNACNALRETFQEKDIIRFHPIMTHGGDMVNAIPESATIESYVRGATFEAMVKNNKRLNQALIGAALSLDNNIEIIDKSGYAPLYNDLNMLDLARDAYKELYPDREYDAIQVVGSGSTDMGDLCCVMPVVHPYACGATGTGHGNNYYIADPEKACIDSAKWQLNMLLMLTKDNAKLAKKIIKEYKPMFKNKEEYIEYCDKLNCAGNRIDYQGETATVKF